MKRLAVRPLARLLRTLDGFYQAHRDDEAKSAAHFSLGRHSYGAPRLIRNESDTARIRIGAFCSIAPEVSFLLGGNHRTQCVSTFPFRTRFGLPKAAEEGSQASKGDIVVGNDVWIGHGAFIMSGVTIGDGAVIGAKTVVAGDVRPYAIVIGNPAREIRRRFTDQQIADLLEIAWWDWPPETIRQEVSFLSGRAIDEFIARFHPSAAA